MDYYCVYDLETGEVIVVNLSEKQAKNLKDDLGAVEVKVEIKKQKSYWD